MAEDLARLAIKVDSSQAKTAKEDLQALGSQAGTTEGLLGKMGLASGSASGSILAFAGSLGITAIALQGLNYVVQDSIQWQAKQDALIQRWAQGAEQAGHASGRLSVEIGKQLRELTESSRTLEAVQGNERKLAIAREELLGLGPKYRSEILKTTGSYDELRKAIEKVNAAERQRIDVELGKLEKRIKDATPGKGTALLDAILGGGSAPGLLATEAALNKVGALQDRVSELHKAKAGLLPLAEPTEKPKKDGTSERISETERFLETLQRQADTLGFSRAQLLAYEAGHLSLTAAQRQVVIGELAKIDAFDRAKDAEKQAAKDALEHARAQKELEDRYTALTHALEPAKRLEDQHAQGMSTINAMLGTKILTVEEYTRAQRQLNATYTEGGIALRNYQADLAREAQTLNDRFLDPQKRLAAEKKRLDDMLGQGLGIEAYYKRLRELEHQGSEAFQHLQLAGQTFADAVGNAFANFATTGKASFRSLVSDMLAQLARLESSRAFTQLLDFAMNAWLNSGSGHSLGGNLAGSTGGSGAGPFDGGGLGSSGGTGYGLASPGGSMAGLYMPPGEVKGAAAGQSVTMGNVSVVVNMDGAGRASGSAQADEGDGRKLGDAIKGAVVSELLVQMRPGGVLNRGRDF